jgi:hypothetical protein
MRASSQKLSLLVHQINKILVRVLHKLLQAMYVRPALLVAVPEKVQFAWLMLHFRDYRLVAVRAVMHVSLQFVLD